jgi:hypothetical protein
VGIQLPAQQKLEVMSRFRGSGPEVKWVVSNVGNGSFSEGILFVGSDGGYACLLTMTDDFGSSCRARYMYGLPGELDVDRRFRSLFEISALLGRNNLWIGEQIV